jgi:hypothetical protein
MVGVIPILLLPQLQNQGDQEREEVWAPLRSLEANRIIVSYLLNLLSLGGAISTETMLQSVESLIDIFADECAPAEANFRAGNVLAALEGAVEGVRRVVKDRL